MKRFFIAISLVTSLFIGGCKTIPTSDLSIRMGFSSMIDLQELSEEARAEVCSKNIVMMVFFQSEYPRIVASPLNRPEQNVELNNLRIRIRESAIEYHKLILAQMEDLHKNAIARDRNCNESLKEKMNGSIGSFAVASVIDGPESGDSEILMSTSFDGGYYKKPFTFRNGQLNEGLDGSMELFLSRDINRISRQVYNELQQVSGISVFDLHIYALKGHSGLISYSSPVHSLGDFIREVEVQQAQGGLFERYDDFGRELDGQYIAPIWSREVVCATRYPKRDANFNDCLDYHNLRQYNLREHSITEQGGRTDGGNQGGRTDDGNQGGRTDDGNQGGRTDGGNQGGRLDGGNQNLVYTDIQGLGLLSEQQGMGKVALHFFPQPDYSLELYFRAYRHEDRPIGVAVLGPAITTSQAFASENETAFTPPYPSKGPNLFIADTCFATHFVQGRPHPLSLSDKSFDLGKPNDLRLLSLAFPGPTHKNSIRYGELNGAQYATLLYSMWNSNDANSWENTGSIPFIFGGKSRRYDEGRINTFVNERRSIPGLSSKLEDEFRRFGSKLLPFIVDGPPVSNSTASNHSSTPQMWLQFALGQYLCMDGGQNMSSDNDRYRPNSEIKVGDLQCFSRPPFASNHLRDRVQYAIEIVQEYGDIFLRNVNFQNMVNWASAVKALHFWIDLHHLNNRSNLDNRSGGFYGIDDFLRSKSNVCSKYLIPMMVEALPKVALNINRILETKVLVEAIDDVELNESYRLFLDHEDVKTVNLLSALAYKCVDLDSDDRQDLVKSFDAFLFDATIDLKYKKSLPEEIDLILERSHFDRVHWNWDAEVRIRLDKKNSSDLLSLIAPVLEKLIRRATIIYRLRLGLNVSKQDIKWVTSNNLRTDVEAALFNRNVEPR